MDALRFDHWTRTLADGARTRRGVLRLALGGGVAAVALGGAAEEALACRRNGQVCDNKKRRGGGCCSGTCKKGKCRPTPGAAGCTVQFDICKDIRAPCPRKRTGTCIVLDTGKPFCFGEWVCKSCSSHADCTLASTGTSGKCIKTCQRQCGSTGNRVCVWS